MLHQEPDRDNFKTESPIRAFSDWNVKGLYALGKGFRPSLQHMVPYMDAMERIEGWCLVQVLEAATQTPSFLFRQGWTIPDDVLLQRIKSPEMRAAFEEQLESAPVYTVDLDIYRELSESNEIARKMACGLRLLAIDMLRAWTIEGEIAKGPASFVDRIRGYADELYADQPGFREAGEKTDIYRQMAGMIRTPEAIRNDQDRRAGKPLTFPEHKIDWSDDPRGEPSEPADDPVNPVDMLEDIAESMVDGETIKGLDRESFAKARNMAGQEQEWSFVHYGDHKGDHHLGPPVTFRGQPLNVSVPGDTLDDPINPKHYAGTACAEIGERLTGNSYQVLKYNWRLGQKDNPCVELGKSIWYLDREMALTECPLPLGLLPDHKFFDRLLEGQDDYVTLVARTLISWNRYGNPATLNGLYKTIQGKLDSMNGCLDYGRQLEP